MDDPVAEIRDVVRSVTEPYEGATLAANVEKYFTEDAMLQHPQVVIARAPNSREAIKGIYKMFRVLSIDQKIVFKSVMFNEDKTQVAIDLIEHLNFRHMMKSKRMTFRLIVLLDLVQEADGKYRISKQEDNFPTETLAFPFGFVPGLASIINIYRNIVGQGSGMLGNFLLARGWLGP